MAGNLLFHVANNSALTRYIMRKTCTCTRPNVHYDNTFHNLRSHAVFDNNPTLPKMCEFCVVCKNCQWHDKQVFHLLDAKISLEIYDTCAEVISVVELRPV